MKKIIYILGIFILSISCNEDNLASLNEDTKNPAEVPAYALFTNAIRTTANQVGSTNVNRNIFRLVNQQWTETTYIDESIYEWTSRKISENHWNNIYAESLADLNQARQNLMADVILATDPDYKNKTAIKKNQLALIDILMVYNFKILVDTFGDIPYSEALKNAQNYLVKYDKAVDIYKDLIDRLNKDISSIDTSKTGFGDSDVLYKGDVIKWVKFANSIKLQLGVNIKASGLDNTLANSTIMSASSNVFTSNDDNAKVAYTKNLPNTNPLYVDMVFSGRNDFVPAKPFVDALNFLSDPRRKVYFADNKSPYVGGVIGTTNRFSNFTHVNDIILAPEYSVTLLDYSEVEFLLAESVARGATVGNVESHYNKAIEASMLDWGVSDDEITLYLNRSDVAYSTADGNWNKKIGEQAWYAMFNRGFEGWSFTRRLDYPNLVAPTNAATAANGKIPVRMTYPIREQTLNPTNYKAASSAIGGDHLYTPIFWDK